MDAKCTVVMPLYNKEEFIEQAINSVLEQKVREKIQLIIADDCSTDKSLEIAEKYADLHRDLIKVLKSERNQGLLANDIRVFENMKTDYFCVLDPDDYWIDNDFLQKAIDFLDANPEFICYSSNTIVDEEGERKPYIDRKEDNIVTESIEDYLDGKAVVPHTTAAVYRNVIYKYGVPSIIKNAVGTISESSFRGDQDRFVMHLKYGKAMFKNEMVGFYRIYDGGMWGGEKKVYQYLLEAQAKFDYSRFYDGVYEDLFLKQVRELYYVPTLILKKESEAKGEFLNDKGNELFDCLNNKMMEYDRRITLEKKIQAVEDHIQAQNQSLHIEQYKVQKEILWANIFHDTIRGSRWFPDDISLSPGRWALGYPALYALYRVLEEVQPKSVLELGLGQSTKLTSSYAKYKSFTGENCEHIVIEHDKEWIQHFSRSFDTKDINIIQLNMGEAAFSVQGIGDVRVNVYEGFQEKLQGKKFDFIFIDAPSGSDEYSRIDLINILPDCLNESFVIFMDDYNRIGEQRSVALITTILNEHHIRYCTGGYGGEKTSLLIVSEDLHFLCTM